MLVSKDGLNECRVHTKGSQALSVFFRKFDPSNKGKVSEEAFKTAVRSMNMGSPFTDKSISMLLGSCTPDSDGAVDYEQFVEQIQAGLVKHKPLNPLFKHRANPDPEKPLGASKIK